MTKDQLRDEILRLVIQTFLHDWKSTSRKRLIVQFEDSPILANLINELDQSRVLVRGSRGDFLPSAIAFYLAADEGLLQRAETSFVVVAQAMRELYLSDVEGNNYSREQVLHQIKKLDPTATDTTLELGFFFIQEFQLSGGYSSDQSGRIQSYAVPEHLALIKDFEAAWDDGMQKQLPRKSEAVPAVHLPRLRIPRSAMSFALEEDESGCLDLDSEVVHPTVREIARTRIPHNLADAVEASLKEFSARVRKIVKDQTGKEYDGAPLMQKAFSVDNPVLRLGDLNTVDGRNMQQGYQMIFAGAMIGIRNPKAHSNIEITPQRAMQFLVLASLMMEKLDEATGNANVGP